MGQILKSRTKITSTETLWKKFSKTKGNKWLVWNIKLQIFEHFVRKKLYVSTLKLNLYIQTLKLSSLYLPRISWEGYSIPIICCFLLRVCQFYLTSQNHKSSTSFFEDNDRTLVTIFKTNENTHLHFKEDHYFSLSEN